MIRRPPRSTRTDTLFPYTTLFRSGLGDPHLLVAVDLLQGVIEGVGRVVGTYDLLASAPALRGTLLEQPDRVPITVLDVDDLRFLVRCGQGDADRPRRQATTYADGCDQRGVLGLPPAELHLLSVDLDLATVRSRQGPEAAVHCDRYADDHHDHRLAAADPLPGGHGQSLACRAALSSMPWPFHAPASRPPSTK